MGYNKRMKRDGTGPYKDSYMRAKFGHGWRARLGYDCPIKKVDTNIKKIN